MGTSISKLKARAEVVLRLHGLNFQFIEDNIGSKRCLSKEDKNKNIMFIGPTGKMVIISSNNKIFTTKSYYCVNFANRIKYPDYSLELFEKTNSNQMEIDFSNPNVKEVDLTTKPSEIIINDTKKYPNIKWQDYLGKEVVIKIIGKRTEQVVLSVEVIEKDEPRLASVIRDLVEESRKMPNVEIGQWIIFGKKKIYKSKLFTSKRFKEIGVNEAFETLAETIKNALQQENESDLYRLTLLHTHPIAGAPLSFQDITSLQIIARELEVKKENTLEIFAIPTPDNGSILFRYIYK